MSSIVAILARRKFAVLFCSLTFLLFMLWIWTFVSVNRFPGADYLLKDYAVAEARNTLLPKTTSQIWHSASRPKKASVAGESLLFEDERLKVLEKQQRRSEDLDRINNMEYDRELSSTERQSQYERDIQRIGVPVIPGIGPDTPYSPHERLVHLDLKGAPPKLSFLKELLPVLRSLGATGLLIEYEDMFPYKEPIQMLSARNAYNYDELKDFLRSVTEHGLSIMPLVQTFGHLEFVLKLEEFQYLREIGESPQSLCPSNKKSISLISELLTQIIEFHANISGALSPDSNGAGAFTHIHIGCDEVYGMGSCDKCRQRAKHEIFLTHVTTISSLVRTKWPNIKIVIWDDMLREMSLSELRQSQIGHYVEPMIWVYANDIYKFIHPHLWDMYSRVFPTAWAASAFKGAFGESLMIPPLQQHLENNLRWLAVIAEEGKRFSNGFRGLALTGWQRYDHFAVLCELLPTALPSLITSLSSVSKGYFSTDPKENTILKVLQCAFQENILKRAPAHAWIELHPNSHHSQLFSSCTYPGSQIYKYSLKLYDKLMQTQTYLVQAQDRSAWMSAYNVRHNFSAPLRVHDLIANTPNIINDLVSLANEANSLLQDIYDEYTIGEFIEQNIYSVILTLRQQLKNGNALLQWRTWPQRPLPIAREIFEFNLMPVEVAKDYSSKT